MTRYRNPRIMLVLIFFHVRRDILESLPFWRILEIAKCKYLISESDLLKFGTF